MGDPFGPRFRGFAVELLCISPRLGFNRYRVTEASA
jgi:hypothetical protein